MWRCVGAGWEGEVKGMADDGFYIVGEQAVDDREYCYFFAHVVDQRESGKAIEFEMESSVIDAVVRVGRSWSRMVEVVVGRRTLNNR